MNEIKKAQIKEAIIEELKKLIAPAIFIIICIAVFFILSGIKKEEETQGMVPIRKLGDVQAEYVLENENLKFVLDSSTSQFSVTSKKDGAVWYSNPQDVTDSSANIASDVDKIKSTINLIYSSENGVDTFINNYKYSIVDSLYEIEADDNQVKVLYTIGEVNKEYIIPRAIDAARFEELISGMSSNDRESIKESYKKYDINNLSSRDNKEELLEKYPTLSDTILYVLRDGTKEHKKVKFEKLFGEAGYTSEEYMAETELYGFETSADKPIYNVSVIYRLENNDLVVEVPMNEIECKKEYPLITIDVLPFFGAGNKTDEGFMFVPEGGGAIINFNNGKTSQNGYYANMYGWNYITRRDAVVHETKAYFGTFGIAKDDSSFICMLENGSTYSSLIAEISGKGINYNYVYSRYNVLLREKIELGNRYSGDIFLYESELPQESIVQRYRFVPSDNYVDMANAYHDYLVESFGDAFAKNTDSDVPVAVEIVGAVDKVKQVVGIPVSRPLKLTTYEDAKNILSDLNANGVNNMSVKLSGWMNGGVKQKYLDDVTLVSSLGGASKLKALTTYASDNNIDLYVNGITNYAYDSDFFDGFITFRDAATFANKKRAKLLEYDPVFYGEMTGDRDPYYLLKPQLVINNMNNLFKAAEKYSANGVAFEDVGFKLSSDLAKKNHYTREAVMNMQVEELNKIAASGKKVMVNMGNDYTLGSVDMITNMDLGGSEYTILDKLVPFYEIAIHGYVNYTGEPINLSGDYKYELLKSAEYGAGLNVTFVNDELTNLQNTYYTQYFGAYYTDWKDKFLDIYNRYESELNDIYNVRMTDHNVLMDGVTVTAYENGKKVYVNYRYEDITVDGVTINARDYKVVEK